LLNSSSCVGGKSKLNEAREEKSYQKDQCMENARKKHTFFTVFSGCYPSNFGHEEIYSLLLGHWLGLSCISSADTMHIGDCWHLTVYSFLKKMRKLETLHFFPRCEHNYLCTCYIYMLHGRQTFGSYHVQILVPFCFSLKCNSSVCEPSVIQAYLSWLGSLWWNLVTNVRSPRLNTGAHIFLDLF
jgi:hypothetical protein